jgi:hypothetical protein
MIPADIVDDIGNFLFADGGILFFSFAAAGLFGLRAVITFLMWRDGRKTRLLEFLSYALGTAALLIGSIYIASILAKVSLGKGFGDFAIYFFLIGAAAAAGLQIFNFIWTTWIKEEQA